MKMAEDGKLQSAFSSPAVHVVLDTSSKHHHGLGLWPPPSRDENDPLRWPRRSKIVAFSAMELFNFVANFAASGFSVATVLLEMEFHKSRQSVNGLLTVIQFFSSGVGNMVWVPLSVKFGKRPVMITTVALLFAILAWTAKAKTFTELLIARCLSGFVSAAGESILPGVVSDIFFLHERGTMMAVYVILISSGTAVGPLIAGFMVQSSPGKWRDFSWLCAALAAFDLLGIFFLYPESSFHRPPLLDNQTTIPNTATGLNAQVKTEIVSNHIESSPEAYGHDWVVSVSYRKVWTSFLHIDKRVNLPKAFVVPAIFLLSIPVLWAVFVYGCALASQVIMVFAFPSFLQAPPYFFPPSSVGLMQIAGIIGFVIACYGGGYMCDVITARLIIRNNGTFVPEQRLVSLLPGCLVAPAGCILIAFSCNNHLHWVAVAFGFGMVSFGTVYAPNIAVTFLLDCYPAFAQEILVAVNVVKNLVAFLLAYVAVDWTNSQGWVQVYMVIFMLVALSMILAIPLYYFGEKARNQFEKILVRVVGPLDG